MGAGARLPADEVSRLEARIRDLVAASEALAKHHGGGVTMLGALTEVSFMGKDSR